MPDRYPNNGTIPHRWKGKEIRVRWSNGRESRWAYKPESLNWARDGKRLEITEFWIAEG